MSYPSVITHSLKGSVRKIGLWAQAAVLTVAGVAPILAAPSVSAAQITNRSIAISSSEISNTGTSYAVSFRPATSTGNAADDILGIVVDFCTSPIIGAACTNPTGMSGFPTSGTIAVAHTGATGTPVNFTAQDPGGGVDRLVITSGTGLDVITTTNPITFTITGITNPSTTGSFYARILTYNTTGGATSYAPATPGTHLDDGGVAMSTANQLTISARVQEILQFCVGTTDAASANDCTDISGTNVDLGVLDSASVTASADTAGLAMVRTNAVNGVTIGYFAEQSTLGTNHLGALRVQSAGNNCNVGSVETDQCINSQGTTQGTFSAGVENFGMTVQAIDTSNGSTTNVTRDAQYDGAAGGYAWDETGTLDTIATSSTVVDDEMLPLKFAGTVDITTPTGAYSVTATFIATATF